ncbi:unnamed protein product, partial [Larinioides sclopetarius]
LYLLARVLDVRLTSEKGEWADLLWLLTFSASVTLVLLLVNWKPFEVL